MTFSGKPACLFQFPLAKKPWSLASPFPPCPCPARPSLSGLTGACALRLCSLRVPVARAHSGSQHGCRLYLEPRRIHLFWGFLRLYGVARDFAKSWGRSRGPGPSGDDGQLQMHASHPPQGQATVSANRPRAAEPSSSAGFGSGGALLAGGRGRPRGTRTAPGFYGCVRVGSE